MTEIVEHQISLSNVEAIGHTHPSQTRINGTFDPSLAQRPQTSSGADEEEDEGSAPPIPHPHPHRSPKTPSTSLLPISSPTNWQQQPEGELAYVEPAHLAPRSRSPLPPFPDPHFDSLYALQEILRLAPVDHSPRPRAPSSPSSSCPSSSSPPRAARLFWWGFAFPPLWLIGLSHLHPSCCPSPTSASSSPCSPPRLVAKLRGRGELELGKTALVIIPHGSNLEKSDQPSHLDGDWNPLSESPAERFVSAGHTNFQALEGFVPDAQFPPGHLRDVSKLVCLPKSNKTHRPR